MTLEKILSLSACLIALASPVLAEGTRAINPALTVKLDESTLPQTLQKLENNLGLGYNEKRRGDLEQHQEGKVTLGVEKSSGREQPIIYLHDGGSYLDKLYFSQIETVKLVPKEQNEAGADLIVFSYALPIAGENGLLAKEIVSYGLIAERDAEITASYFSALAQHYSSPNDSEERKEGCEEVKQIEKIVHVEIPRIYLDSSQIKAICGGEELSLPMGYKVEPVAQLYYDDCAYDPKKDLYHYMQETSKIIQKVKENPRGVIITCGNADIRSVEKCSLPSGEGNFLLSFYRTENFADELITDGKTELGEVTIIPYPNGTRLDEKSVRIYYIYRESEKGGER